MNNRPTPETDAESCYPDSNLGECVCADFARKLERERDEAQADCLEQARLLGMGSEREARLISERDDLEFRRGLYKVQEQYLETARRERDEARVENAKLRDIANRAINYLNQSYRDGFADEVSDLRYEIEQLKEGTK